MTEARVTASPVLLLVFNRPDTTALIMDAIRRARPPRLYVAADGPRERAGEAALCAEVRRIATAVDWDCELRTLFRDANLRGPAAIPQAIDWFFAHEAEGVILEDDCLPAPDFFRFCDTLLERFRNEPRVMSICGSCYCDDLPDEPDYYFSYYSDPWGWATWRRAWQARDPALDAWRTRRRTILANVPRETRAYWAGIFDDLAHGRINHWDYRWIFSLIARRGLACYPRSNLISNMGFRPDAQNTVAAVGGGDARANRALGSLNFPLRHPRTIARNAAFDTEMNWRRLRIPPIVRRTLFAHAASRLKGVLAAAGAGGRRALGARRMNHDVD